MVTARGFSTIEMLVAMTIMVLVLSAALLLSFGSQSLLADSVGHTEALSLAGEMLGNEEALAHKDFNLVVPGTNTTTIGSTVYTKSIEVDTQNNSLTKKVDITVSWAGEYGRAEEVSLGAYVTNFENAFSSDTCNTELAGNWDRSHGDKHDTKLCTACRRRLRRLYTYRCTSAPRQAVCHGKQQLVG